MKKFTKCTMAIRAKAAVIELCILASRLGIIEDEKNKKR